MQPTVPMGSPQPQLDRSQFFPRSSRINGSAYGYGSDHRRRLSSSAPTITARKSSFASSFPRGRTSGLDSTTLSDGSDLNFAQRLLMANENAVTNIADLWVAAAMNVDNEDPFETDEDEGMDSTGSADSFDLGDPLINEEDTTPTSTVRGRRFSQSRIAQNISPTRRSSHRPSFAGAPSSHISSHLTSPHQRSISRALTTSISGLASSRRLSSTVPSIFSHPGVKTPPAFLDVQRLGFSNDEVSTAEGEGVLSGTQVDAEALMEKLPSLTSLLPIAVIIQYGMLALHTTTHDQIFMSYLVTYVLSQWQDCESHFVQGLPGWRFKPQRRAFCTTEYVISLPITHDLPARVHCSTVALMCLAQIAYQFYLYP